MANTSLSLEEIVVKAAARALPARKFVRIVSGWLADKDLPTQDEQDQVTAAVLASLVNTHSPSALLLGYLTQILSAGLTTSRTIVIHILFLSSNGQSLSPPVLTSIANLVLSNPSGSNANEPFPSTLVTPWVYSTSPDIGTSASAQTTPVSMSTLGLLLPLLRMCSVSSDSPPLTPLVALVSRLVSLLQPYPAPPLDIGLEAGGLFQSLPETISLPLRECLSGLMADLASSQETSQLQQLPTNPDQSNGGVNGKSNGAVDGPSTHSGQSIPSPLLPPLHTQISLPHILAFLLTLDLHSSRWTLSPDPNTSPPKPADHHIELVKLGPHIESDPSTFLLHLIRAAITSHVGHYIGSTTEGTLRWLFMSERLPTLLRWWKDNSDPKWPYPASLNVALSTVFEADGMVISENNSWMSSVYTSFISGVDIDDDSGGFVQPEGWMLGTLEVTVLQRLVELELLSRQEAASILPDISMPSDTPGESLMARVATAPKSHFRPLAHLISFAPGAARSLAIEVYNCIRACPQTYPPEGLFVNLASEPALLACLSGNISGATWIDVARTHLLDAHLDPAARADDPQGFLTRFGEGVILVEAMASLYKVPLPDLLRDSRLAVSLADLDQTKRSCVNGWVKALFGPDGIDDQILLTTSPPEFYRLAPGIIQQAILATASGQLDMDTLHSGMSYFSQPLLSWSLGGIVGWLCMESTRLGLLSAFHLNVLQNLVMSSSLPISILRFMGVAIANILEPSAGLGQVFQSSGIDVAGMQNKLELVNIVSEPYVPRPLEALRSELQVLRSPDMASRRWSSQLCDALDTALRYEGCGKVLDMIVQEVLTTVRLPLGTVAEDGFTHFVVLAIILRLSAYTPTLMGQLIDAVFPSIFEANSKLSLPLIQPNTASSATAGLARLLRHGLIMTGDLDPARGDVLADHLLDEIAYQRARPRSRSRANETKGLMVNGVLNDGLGHGRGRKKTSVINDVQPLSDELRRVLEALCGALGYDDELKSRWSRFGELVGTPT